MFLVVIQLNLKIFGLQTQVAVEIVAAAAATAGSVAADVVVSDVAAAAG